MCLFNNNCCNNQVEENKTEVNVEETKTNIPLPKNIKGRYEDDMSLKTNYKYKLLEYSQTPVKSILYTNPTNFIINTYIIYVLRLYQTLYDSHNNHTFETQNTFCHRKRIIT